MTDIILTLILFAVSSIFVYLWWTTRKQRIEIERQNEATLEHKISYLRNLAEKRKND